jgi:hypothetical protein
VQHIRLQQLSLLALSPADALRHVVGLLDRITESETSFTTGAAHRSTKPILRSMMPTRLLQLRWRTRRIAARLRFAGGDRRAGLLVTAQFWAVLANSTQ